MKKIPYRVTASALLLGLATAGYSQVKDSISVDSSSVQVARPQANETWLLTLAAVLGVYALVLSYLYFVDARSKLRKRASTTWPPDGATESVSPPNLVENKRLRDQVTQLRREAREREDFIKQQEIDMEAMRLQLKQRPVVAAPPPEMPEPPPAPLKTAPPPVTRFYLATPNSDGSFVNNPAPQFDPSRSLYEFELAEAGTEAHFSFASDAATIANALSHPDRYLMPACLYPVPPTTARTIRTTTPGKARLSPDGQRWMIEQKAQILFE